MLPSFDASLSAVALLLPSLAVAQTLSLSIQPNRAGAIVSDNLSPTFAGFGIEPSNLFSFTGNSEPNYQSLNLLQNLADYAGAPPHIRLGGNTGDYMIWNESYTAFNWMNNEQSVAQGVYAADSMIIGPGYFQALDRFPKGTWVTYGLNLAYQESDYIQRIVTQAQAALTHMKNVELYSLEIGNEPDLYLGNGFRTGAWDGAAYVQAFFERADAIYQQVLKPAGMSPTFFEPACTASTIGNTFNIPQLASNGILNQVNNNFYTGWWNQHDYFQFIGVTSEPITLDNLMNLDSTNVQFAYWEKEIKVALSTGVPYVLREMSSVGPIGMAGVTDTFGAALWTLNFFMYTATLNVSSVQMHMTDNSNASAWQPITVYGRKPFVRPQYYAHAAVAQIIGNGNGTTQIGALDTSKVSGAYKGRIRAYSAYANGAFQAAVLINSRPSVSNSFVFTLNLGSTYANRRVFLSYLTADNYTSETGTTWNGIEYDDATGKASVVGNTVYVQQTTSTGSIDISVRDSQAIVANLDWQLGSNEVLQADGSTTSGSRRKNSAAAVHTGSAVALWAGAITIAWAFLSLST